MTKKEKQREYRKKYKETHPWGRFLKHAKARCNDPKHKTYKDYGMRGVTCTLNTSDVKEIWIRDLAHRLKRPSLDRINPTLPYRLDNCRFIELSVNCARTRRTKKGILK